MSTPTPFLIDERNRPFVQGLAARPPAAADGRMGAGCMVAFFIPFVLAGMVMLSLTFSSWASWLSFQANARPATAVVTGKVIDDGGEDTAYYLDYRYTTSDDRRFDGRASVSRDRYNALVVGEPLSIEYLSDDPATSRVAAENHLGMPLFLTAFSLFWNGFILVVIYVIISRGRYERQLRAEGQLAPAEIIDYTAYLDSDNDLNVAIEYRLRAPDGHTVSGRYERVRNELKGAPAPACPTPAAALYIDERTHMLL
ncbi:DUF3592 domain-containing protein [Oscillochloris sp. ZM17-4]|uniref:DUF3592 domain-containing protein n=1 Tax=Oscillochloris sp. ZM17-4 TaxID=2866714 RepID=UPI001C72AE47|nr:DUF3592 domain-containing protein [Oscillochloris sp. ZM17-4]MBX0327729.1 DUF3592 domain-containing protein [Oscillochloris sp. ZM17-4]